MSSPKYVLIECNLYAQSDICNLFLPLQLDNGAAGSQLLLCIEPLIIVVTLGGGG